MRQHFSSLLNGMAKSVSLSLSVGGEKRSSEEEAGREAAEALVREAKKRNMILRSCGNVDAEGCKIFASVHTKRGEKGVNQDCCLVWEVLIFTSPFLSFFFQIHAFGSFEFCLLRSSLCLGHLNFACCSPLCMMF